MNTETPSVRIGTVIVLLALALCAWSQEPRTDEWFSRPVDEKTFRAYAEFFAYDRNLPLDPQILSQKDAEGVHLEHFSFQSTPGERVFGNFSAPTGGNPRELPAVILLHGGASLGKDGPRYIALSDLLARAGFIVLAIDMKHFGERTSGLLKTFTEAEKHDMLYNQPSLYLSWVIQVVKDLGRSIDFLVVEKGVNPKRVGFLGVSRGAEVGFIAVAVEKRLSPAVFLHGGHFDALEKSHLAAACPANYIGRIAPRSFLMVNGERDADYDMETQVKPLFALARSPKQSMWLPGGHSSYSDKDLSEIVAWLHAHLK